jgi:hypothetical protein
VKESIATIRGLPWAIFGAIAAGVIGGITGLIVGLFVYAPTAWFAAFELGIPAFLAGGAAGLLAGTIGATARRIRHHGAGSL